MYNEEQTARRFYAISFADDEPTISSGSLIPRKVVKFAPRTLALPAPTPRVLLAPRVIVLLATLVLILLGGVGGATLFERYGDGMLAAVIGSKTDVTPVVVVHPYTNEPTPLTYGIEVAFTEPDFFVTTRDAFIDASRTFIEADLATMKLRYFEQGVLHHEFKIVRKGETGTFWETPAGLYAVEQKRERQYVSFGQVYLPFSLAFQGNFYIHGTPYSEGGGEVATSTGGIELSLEDAETLYGLVSRETPVLVYERPVTPDTFLYEPKVPELATPHYLIADVKSSTVLASSDLNTAVPIASLTKLMTAVVAAEYINLDTRVAIIEPTFVQSLIPRLQERSSVSMYSLLELLLLESSNEAAEVIAGVVGREKFIEYMNERAKALGMEHTTFTDPSGLDAGNKSSVGDLLRLSQYIYEKRRFIMDISAGRKLPDIYVSGEFSNLSNFNDVEDLDNFIGGKIGETAAAGQTSVTLHTLQVKGEERVVAIIILGSKGRNADVKALMQYATERFGN
jgi:lipoprotein-anchoring transpeptidase ErfK/SrfK